MKKYILCSIVLLFISFSHIGAISKDTILYKKDLGYGFILEQTENNTYFRYRKTEIIVSNNSDKIVGSRDVCMETNKKYGAGWGAIESTHSSGEIEKIEKICNKEALRNYYQPKIFKTEDSRFYIIRGQGYESIGFSLFDIKTKTNTSLGWSDEFKDTKKYIRMNFQYGKNGIYFFINSTERGGDCYAGVYLVNNSGIIPQKNLCVNEKDPSTNKNISPRIIIQSIELQKNARIKINYITTDDEQNILEKNKSTIISVVTR